MKGQRRRMRELAVHLTLRQLASTHRFTVLGWAWPLTRQLAQLAVLVFLFGHVLKLHLHDYAVFVFAGLISWSWFATSVDSATSSLLSNRHLVFQPRFPPAVLPVVAVAAGLVDVLIALPVLIVMLIVAGDLKWTIVLLPLLFVVQFALTCGVAWITSVATVYLRDVRGIVAVGLTVLFYLTPVFYRVPGHYETVLHINPLTTLLEAYRALLLGSGFPPVGRAVAVVVVSAALAAIGALVFKRFSGGIVDEL